MRISDESMHDYNVTVHDNSLRVQNNTTHDYDAIKHKEWLNMRIASDSNLE
jgi:hypothetical protein